MMRTMYRLVSFFLLMLMHQTLLAQVTIQVTLLPPHQSDITLYGSKPNLLIINLINTSNQELSVQLHGSISGDNGITLSSKASTRSSHPIVIPPMGTTQLNGMELANIFNLSQLDMVGIGEQDFLSGSGLPEGNYTFCVRAFDYHDLSTPLSPEEPNGCSFLMITTHEPPVITSPFDGQEISSEQMGFNISWMTTGAPEVVYYTIKLVEVLSPQNPKDIFESSSPIFEASVNSNFYFYGPQNPQLVTGRQYVLGVEAFDPLQKANFRNNGLSELLVFTYGGQDIWAMADSAMMTANLQNRAERLEQEEKEGEAIEDNEFATNRIKGKLLWGFVSNFQHSVGKKDLSGLLISGGNSIFSGNFAGVSKNNLVNPVGLAGKDPTSIPGNLNTGTSPGMYGSSRGVAGSSPGNGFGASTGQNKNLQNAAQVLSSSGTRSTRYGYGTEKSEAPKGDAPLAGVYVTIKGLTDHSVVSGLSGTPRKGTITSQVLLGTGKSDHSGLFEVELVDPKYAKLDGFTRIVMQVNSADFEPYEVVLDKGALAQRVNVDIGAHILTAKTFVFEPSFVLQDQENYATVDTDLEVTIYRRVSDLAEHDYLRHEGDLAANDRVEKRIDNINLVAVSKRVFSLKDQRLSSFPNLFFSNSLYIEVLPVEVYVKERKEEFTVNIAQAIAAQQLVVKPEYLLEIAVPAITGRVMADLAGSSSGVYGAYVQVSFQQQDVVSSLAPQESQPPAGTSSASAVGEWIYPPYMGGKGVYRPSQHTFDQVAGAGTQQGLPTGNDLLNGPAAQALNDYANGPGLQPYTAQTYENGEYSIKHLPLLKKGAKYTVKLIEVPARYRHMRVDTLGRDTKIDVFAQSIPVDFTINANTIALKGQLVDTEGNGVYMENMQLRDIKSITTTSTGEFVTTIPVDHHFLDIKGKLGFIDTTLSVAFTDIENPGTELDLGKIVLKRKISKSLFTILDKNNPSIPIPGVEIQLGDTRQVSNEKGQWLYEGPGGKSLITFIPAESSGYVATQVDIDLDFSGTQKEYTIHLEKGVKLSGTVRSGGKTLSQASIQIDQKSYLSTTTNAQGVYSLMVPNTNRKKIVQAAKSGYYTDKKEQVTQGGQITLDFDLKDGDGRNISTLLGFDIQLDQSQEQDGKTMWSGKFINLHAPGELFKGSRPQQLAFSKLEVTFDQQGNAIPKNNEVPTHVKQLRLMLFDYLPVLLTGQQGKVLTVTADENRVGGISGLLEIDVRNWIKNDIGVDVGNLKHAVLKEYNTTDQANIHVFSASKENAFPVVEFVLSKKAGDAVSLDLFGFTLGVDLAKTRISQDGFSTAGYVRTPALGIIQADSMALEHLKISRQGGLQEIKFSHQLPDLVVGNWVASLGKASMDEFGFKLDGVIELSQKATDKEAKGGIAPEEENQPGISFSKLNFTNEGLFGGTFSLPSEGISVLGLVNVKKGETPMTFQKQQDVYSLAGSASFEFSKLIKKPVQVKSFQVQSDGVYFADVATNYSLNLGFANYQLDGLAINSKAEEPPSIELRGVFKVAGVNAFQLEASNLKFILDSKGNADYSIDSIGAAFKTPVFEAAFALGFIDSTGVKGFRGYGSMGIPSTEIQAALKFAYQKYDKDENDENQYFLEAGFRAGAIIPIGAVTLDSVGGGFAYNTQKKEFMVEIGGNASILNAKHLAQLKDLKLRVTSNSGLNSGVVIHGETDVVVGSLVNLAKAKVTLNTAAKQFIVNVDGQFSPVDQLAKVQINGDLIVQWHPEDTYVFLGAHANANLAGIIQGQADFAIGVNVKNPSTHPMTSTYFTNLDPSLARNVFTGAYINGKIKKEAAFDFKVSILGVNALGVNAFVNAGANAVFFVNFAQERELLMRLDGYFNLGAKLEILGKKVVGAQASACFGLAGGYQQSLGGWNFDGYAGLSAKVIIFDENKCGESTLIPPSATLCFDAFIHMNYQRSNFKLTGHLGKNLANNCTTL